MPPSQTEQEVATKAEVHLYWASGQAKLCPLTGFCEDDTVLSAVPSLTRGRLCGEDEGEPCPARVSTIEQPTSQHWACSAFSQVRTLRHRKVASCQQPPRLLWPCQGLQLALCDHRTRPICHPSDLEHLSEQPLDRFPNKIHGVFKATWEARVTRATQPVTSSAPAADGSQIKELDNSSLGLPAVSHCPASPALSQALPALSRV